MKLRDIGKAMDLAEENGDLKFIRKDCKEEENTSLCQICGSKTGPFSCYSWFILNDEDYPDIIEMLFCSKDCWKSFLSKEMKRIN